MRRISITAVADLARLFAGEVRVFVGDCRANPLVYIQERQFPQPPASAHLAVWPDEREGLRYLGSQVPRIPLRRVLNARPEVRQP